jgi:transposase InsO family protein
MGYSYVIYNIPGETNVWADLLSRWGSTLPSICAVAHQPLLVSPLRDVQFEWPTIVAIAEAQAAATSKTAAPDDVSVGDDQVTLPSGASWTMRRVHGVWWIPAGANELQLRLCVCAHASLAGHRPASATLVSLQSFCWWVDLKTDVEFFVSRCLHCTSSSGGVPRPLGEALHSARPNGLLHWDFLHMGKSRSGETYLLVIKCDASKMVWLFPTADATATFVKQSLLQWFAVFGICYEWVSDQGTHFKNQVIGELQHVLGAHHHFTTARCPWANGTVEVVMRQLLRLFRACLSEWRMSTDQWPEAYLVLMLVLNQLPSPSLGGVAPVTAMSGRPAMSPEDTISLPGHLKLASLSEVESSQRQAIRDVQMALDGMHKRMSEENEKKRDRARTTRDKKKGVQMAQFVVGDYVLYQDVWAHRRDKLHTRWCGPAVVTKVTSHWLYDVENLITHDVRPAHASRLKFYADAQLDVTSDFLAHVAHNSEGFEVESMLDARYSAPTKAYEVLIKWRGLQVAENSWEPADNICDDVPVLFRAFCKSKSSAMVKKMALAYEVK